MPTKDRRETRRWAAARTAATSHERRSRPTRKPCASAAERAPILLHSRVPSKRLETKILGLGALFSLACVSTSVSLSTAAVRGHVRPPTTPSHTSRKHDAHDSLLCCAGGCRLRRQQRVSASLSVSSFACLATWSLEVSPLREIASVRARLTFLPSALQTCKEHRRRRVDEDLQHSGLCFVRVCVATLCSTSTPRCDRMWTQEYYRET